MSDCTRCKHCQWDCTDTGYGHYWFPVGCEKDMDMGAEKCEEYEEEGSAE